MVGYRGVDGSVLLKSPEIRSFLKKSGFDKAPEFYMLVHGMASKMAPDTMMDAAEHGTKEQARTRSGGPQIKFNMPDKK